MSDEYSEVEARFGWRGDRLPTMWRCLGDNGAFCHRVRSAGGGDGAVWSNPGGSVGGNIALQSEDRGEGGEEHRDVGGDVNYLLHDVEEEKKRTGPVQCGHIGVPIRRLDPEEHRQRMKHV